MPYTSKAQQRAMYAAAEGHSTLGIPKKVGKDFVAAGPASSKLPDRRTKGHRHAVKHGHTPPASHSEFERLGS